MRILGSVVSASIGALSLLVSVVIVLASGDTIVDVSGSDSDSSASVRGTDAEGDTFGERCVGPGCVQEDTGDPQVPAGKFPFPPGSYRPVFTDGFCGESNRTSGTTVRAVRMGFEAAKRWYLDHLTDAGYGWRVGRTTAGRNGPVVAWSGLIRTKDPGVSGSLEIKRFHRHRVVCGPDRGELYITVRGLP